MTLPVAPGGTIGILGGGQLGRMLALAASRLGLKTHIFCDRPESPAFEVAAAHTQALYTDQEALSRFAAACDAVTYEFENIPAETAAFLAARVPLRPNEQALKVTQDRLDEKNFVASLGLPTPAFAAVSSPDGARTAFDGGAGVLKTRRFGYDGKGQVKVASAEETVAGFATLKQAPCILESFIDFDFEVSIIAARGAGGQFEAYDLPHNVHRDHILYRSTVPSQLSVAQQNQAVQIAQAIAASLDYIGVFAVELFVGKDGGLMVNEIAPRVHNSGHWTIDACTVSQFEQHIRAVAGWPLGSPERHSDAVMQNLIGDEVANWQALARETGAVHLYGKREIRAGRKLGHITWIKPKT